jgi:hypothetical protein
VASLVAARALILVLADRYWTSSPISPGLRLNSQIACGQQEP